MSSGADELAQVAQDPLRLDRRVVVVAHVERHFEGAVVGRHLYVRQGAVAQQVAELFDRRGEVADQLDLGHVVGVDVGRDRVDADDAQVAVGVPRRRRPFDQVVTHADDQVGAPEEPGRVVLGVQPRGEQEMLVVGVDHALAHERRDHVQAGPPAELAQRPRRSLTHHAVAHEQHGAAGGAYELGGGPQGLVVGLDHRLRHALQAVTARHRGRHHVGGQLEVRGPGLFGGGHRKGLAHRLGHGARVVHAGVPLGHRLHHLDDIDELVGLLVHAREVDLPRDRHKRCVVQVGVGDAGRQVGGARTERRQADAGLAGQPSVGFGHEGGALLVAGRHEGDLAGALERGVQVEGLLAGDAEDVLDTLVFETVDEGVGGKEGCRLCVHAALDYHRSTRFGRSPTAEPAGSDSRLRPSATRQPRSAAPQRRPRAPSAGSAA